jgi:flagellar motor switch protein FliG
MALTGKQKAAMLLMSLDPISASELLRGVEPEVVQELAVELAYLDAAGYANSKEHFEVVQHFCSSLQVEPDNKFQIKNFLKEMLKSTVGEEKAEHIQTQIQDLLKKRDPFMAIRAADPKFLASLLETEHPRAIAVVLSELDPKKSSGVIGLLKEDIRLSAVSRMADSEATTPEAKVRIAEMICKRIDEITAASKGAVVQTTSDQSLRKVAIILRNLAKELRDGLLSAIQQKDSQAGEKITNLMILWEDISLVMDKPLQLALRGIDSRKLALALTKVDDTINKKIRSNISERASATLDEEMSLMSAPKKEEIEQAKQELVDVLRKMNQAGELSFIET